MEREVYADLYVLINSCMDLLCLFLSAAFLHRKLFKWRAWLGAVFGGFYALFALLCGWEGAIQLLSELFAGVCICAVAFLSKKERAVGFLRICAVFLFTSAMLGGVMTALYHWLNSLNLPLENAGEDRISAWMFALLAVLSGLLTLRGGRFFGFSAKQKNQSLRVTLFGKTVSLRAMVDTGNLLRDPVSGRGVILVERKRLAGILPPAVLRPIGDPHKTEWMQDSNHAKSVRLIPSQSATGQEILTALIPTKLELCDAKGVTPLDLLIAPVDLGNTANGFEALLPGN